MLRLDWLSQYIKLFFLKKKKSMKSDRRDHVSGVFYAG